MLAYHIRVLPVNSSVVQYASRALSSLGWHPTGSRALDALTSGGYPGGAIIEVHATDAEPCWFAAWLAAAATLREGRGVFVCGSEAFTKFGQEAGVNLSQSVSRDVAITRRLQPDTLGPAIKDLRPFSSLILVESLAALAEAAAEASPEPAITRSLRSRKLRRLLQEIALTLQSPPQPAGRRRKKQERAAKSVGQLTASQQAEAAADGDGVPGKGSGSKPVADPVPQRPASVIVCNPSGGQQGPYDALLQQHATLRLRLTAEPGAQDGGCEGEQALCEPPGLTVQMLKGPGTNSRMRPPATRLYLHPSPAGDAYGAFPYKDDGAVALFDLVSAAERLGLLSGGVSMGGGSNHASGRLDVEGMLYYRGCEAVMLPDFANRLAAAGLVPALRQEVDSALEALRGQ